VGINYLYQNQVFDYSATYTNQSSVGQIGPYPHATLGPAEEARSVLVEGEMDGTRQWLEEPLDDYWQYGPRAVAGYGWEHGSELTLLYQWSRLDYDHREQADRMGAAITNTSLSLNTHLTELSSRTFGTRSNVGARSRPSGTKPVWTTARAFMTMTTTVSPSRSVSRPEVGSHGSGEAELL